MSEATTKADLDALRRLIRSLPADDLKTIGVKLDKPPPSDWVWLRDIMADALENLGRSRASQALRSSTFDGPVNQYSVGVNADVFAEMGRLIARKFASEQPT